MAKSTPGKRRRSLNVFEAGSGKRPIGLVQQAAKAKNRGLRKRRFTGVDIQKTNLNKLLQKLGVPKKPANLRVVQKCAIEAMRDLKPNSQHIIFSSFLLSYLAVFGKSQNMMKNASEFISAAKKALRPGGRLALVQDYTASQIIKDLALNYGLGFYERVLTDEQAKKSPAHFIRTRATQKRRAQKLKELVDAGEISALGITRLMQMLGLSEPQELLRPTLFVLRKPRKGEKKVEAVTRISLDLIEDPAIRSAVKDILG